MTNPCPTCGDTQDLILTDEVARIVGVSAVTIRIWARTGELPAAFQVRGRDRVIRVYRRTDVERYAADRNQRSQPKEPTP